MISDLVAVGLLSAERYDTPPSRTIVLPLDRSLRKLPAKYVSDILDYRTDWTARMDEDRIVGAAMTTNGGAVVPSRVIFDDTTASFWLSGGRSQNGTVLRLVVRTNGGRALEQDFTIRCF